MKIFDLSENEILLDTIKNNNFIEIGTKIKNIGILFKKVEK